MAKIITPPQIDDLEGLLELVVNPAKGIAYLKSLKDMRDEILALLGVHASKDKVDALLADTTAKHQAASKGLEDSKLSLASTLRECDTRRKKVAEEEKALTDAMQAKQKDLSLREAAINEKARLVLHQSESLATRENVLRVEQEQTDKMKRDLKVEHEKMLRRKAVLSEIG